MDKLRELEIMKAALYTDMLHQKETISKLQGQGRDTTDFKAWLKDTQELYEKVCTKYWELKAPKTISEAMGNIRSVFQPKTSSDTRSEGVEDNDEKE
ncbi:hypothetical protein Goe25_00140 [Bacillus phage vB_BsuM-Goe25]|nr:hypothetical protein Goe25_00140 [Bacillus phage vB_BsuM-Goe25]